MIYGANFIKDDENIRHLPILRPSNGAFDSSIFSRVFTNISIRNKLLITNSGGRNKNRCYFVQRKARSDNVSRAKMFNIRLKYIFSS